MSPFKKGTKVGTHPQKCSNILGDRGISDGIKKIEEGGATFYSGPSESGGEICVLPSGEVQVTPAISLVQRRVLKGFGLKGGRYYELVGAIRGLGDIAGSLMLSGCIESWDECVRTLDEYFAAGTGEVTVRGQVLVLEYGSLGCSMYRQAWARLKSDLMECVVTQDLTKAKAFTTCIAVAKEYSKERRFEWKRLGEIVHHTLLCIEWIVWSTKKLPTKADVKDGIQASMRRRIPNATFTKTLKETGFDWLPTSRPWHGPQRNSVTN